MTYSPIKPVPYYSTFTTSSEHALAKSLRADVMPMLKRLLPYHHLGGLKHNFVIEFIQKHRSKYRYFLRTDIKKFYPSIVHTDLCVGAQIAYRDLLNLNYVPKNFKHKYLLALNEWTTNLPLEHKGIPLSSPLSAVTAPLMLVPTWLYIKRRWNLPIAIYMDDVLILCESKHEISEIYEFLHNTLYAQFKLELNQDKTESGQFSNGKLNFCGWSVSGGYARVSEKHVEKFKTSFKELASKLNGKERGLIIKCLNNKINGFGNFYKHGNVKGQFADLDIFIRSLIRPLLLGKKRCDNSTLSSMGVQTLSAIYSKHCLKFNVNTALHPCTKLKTTGTKSKRTDSLNHEELILASLEAMSSKLSELIALQKKQLQCLKKLTDCL